MSRLQSQEGRQAGTHLGFKPPSPSPVLASPSVNMMMMEVLLSGTRCCSRASVSIRMPLSSPSLMLVPVHRQKDRTIGVGVSLGCQCTRLYYEGEWDSRPCSCAKDCVSLYVEVLGKHWHKWMNSVDFHIGFKGVLRGSKPVMIVATWQAVRWSHQKWKGVIKISFP